MAIIRGLLAVSGGAFLGHGVIRDSATALGIGIVCLGIAALMTFLDVRKET